MDAELIEAGPGNYQFRLEGKFFAATNNPNAVGCIAFAYYAENSFGFAAPDREPWKWLAWHWCALVSRMAVGEIPEDAPFREEALTVACELAPDAATAEDLRRRYHDRLVAISRFQR
jgi:hypothetical protein